MFYVRQYISIFGCVSLMPIVIFPTLCYVAYIWRICLHYVPRTSQRQQNKDVKSYKATFEICFHVKWYHEKIHFNDNIWYDFNKLAMFGNMAMSYFTTNSVFFKPIKTVKDSDSDWQGQDCLIKYFYLWCLRDDSSYWHTSTPIRKLGTKILNASLFLS